MVLKIYGSIWLFFGVLAGGLYLAGVFNLWTGIAFGFIAFSLAYLGMIAVMPIWAESQLKKVKTDNTKTASPKAIDRETADLADAPQILLTNQFGNQMR